MITLQRARFKNFRALRDLEISFSTDAEKNLTVIRAENGTGKTSMLYALTWGLFGDRGLPVAQRDRSRYRLHPIDWNAAAEGSTAEIEVEIDFAMDDDAGGRSTNFRVKRTGSELITPDGFRPQATHAKVFRETQAGWHEIDNPTDFLEVQVLSPALKDIFFTDSDVALDYVEAGSEDVQRKNVEDAVRKLLGLELLESAKDHLVKTRSKVVRKLKSEATDTPLADAIGAEEEADEQVGIYEEQVEDLEAKIATVQKIAQKAEIQRQGILAAGGGNREELGRRLLASKGHIKTLQSDGAEAVTQQRSLLNSADLLNTLAAPLLSKNAQLYESLRSERKIPNVVPDLVRDRLRKRECICGASLAEGTPGHTHLTEQLAEEDRFHESHEILSALSEATLRALQMAEDGPQNWFSVSEAAVANLIRIEDALVKEHDNRNELNAQVKAIPESDLQNLNAKISKTAAEHSAYREQLGAAKSELSGWKTQREGALRTRRGLEARSQDHSLRQNEELVANDLLDIVEGTIEKLQTHTVRQVSNKMNEIFKEMIVSSPEATSNNVIIKSVELSDSFEIVVNGPEGRTIDAANGLSGAQRRALTISFILALVQISGIHAPNVIDTPLGMTSGALRRSFLEYALANSKQLVLFLTRSEITGVEDILEEAMGQQWTLSISSHYPEQLANDPGVDRIEVLICSCGPTETCVICQRNGAGI